MNPLVVPVTYLARATPRAAVVRLGVPGGGLSFEPGQAVSLGLHGQPVTKFYSIASAPADVCRDGEVEFLVGTGEGGQFDAHLAGLEKGTLLDLQGPFGSFGLPTGPHPPHFVFVAGGTGIAPLRAMWRHLVSTGTGALLEVIYSARTCAHFAYRDELEQLARGGRLTLALTATRQEAPQAQCPEAAGPGAAPGAGRPGPGGPHVTPVESGRIGTTHLEGPVARGPAAYVVCGPPAFVAHVARLLDDLRVPREQVRKEGW